MPNTPDRCPSCGGERQIVIATSHPDPVTVLQCPLCGGEAAGPFDAFGTSCVECNLYVSIWPRVAELVAIRDAVVEWEVAWASPDGAGIGEAYERLHELAREELKRQEETP